MIGSPIGCTGNCDDPLFNQSTYPVTGPLKAETLLFQTPSTVGYCVSTSFKNAARTLLSSTELSKVPNVTTLKAFPDWVKVNCKRCRLSKRKLGKPGVHPPPGLHIVFDVNNIHHDAVRIPVDGEIEFFPSSSTVSTSSISGQHDYVINFFNKPYACVPYDNGTHIQY